MQVNALMRVSLLSPDVQVYLINSSMLTTDWASLLFFQIHYIFCLFDFFNKLGSIFRSKYQFCHSS